MQQGFWQGNQFIFPEAEAPEVPTLLGETIEPVVPEARPAPEVGQQKSIETGDGYGHGKKAGILGLTAGGYYGAKVGGLLGGLTGIVGGGLLGTGIGTAIDVNSAGKDFSFRGQKPDIDFLSAFTNGTPLGWFGLGESALDQGTRGYQNASGTGLNKGALQAFAKRSYSGPKGVNGSRGKARAERADHGGKTASESARAGGRSAGYGRSY